MKADIKKQHDLYVNNLEANLLLQIHKKSKKKKKEKKKRQAWYSTP